MSLVGLLAIWKRQRLVVVMFLLLGAGLGNLASLAMPTTYGANADLLLSATNYEPEYGRLGALSAFEFEQVMSTKATLIAKPSIQAAAADRLGLDADEELPAEYQVSRDQGTQIIRIEATGDDPDDVVATVTAIATVFVEEQNAGALAAVATQATEIAARVESTETRLTEISAEINRLSNVLETGSTSFALENLIGERNAFSQKLATELLQRDQIQADLARASRAASVLNVPNEATTSAPLPVAVTIVLGALVFGFIGLGAAALKEELSDRVRSADDIEAALDLRPLAVIPGTRSIRRARRRGRRRQAMTRATNQLLAKRPSDRSTSVMTVASPRFGAPVGQLAGSFGSTLAVADGSTIVVTLDIDPDQLANESFAAATTSIPATLAFDSDDYNDRVDHNDHNDHDDRDDHNTRRSCDPPDWLLDHTSGLLTVPLSKLLRHGTPDAADVSALPSIVETLRGHVCWIVIEAPPILESAAILPFVYAADTVVVATTGRSVAADLTEAVELVERPGSAELGVVLLTSS